jgi:cytochrome P450
VVSALVHGEIEGRKLMDMEVLFNCFLLITGGQETTRNATSGGVLALMDNPDQREELKEIVRCCPPPPRKYCALRRQSRT